MRKATHRYGNNMSGLMTHPQAEMPIGTIVEEPHKGLSGITARLRQKVRQDTTIYCVGLLDNESN